MNKDLPGCDLPLLLLGINQVRARLARSAFSINRLYINQHDLVEQGHQAGTMTRIYQQGYVMAWLGLEEEGVQLGFELLGQCQAFVVGGRRTREGLSD